MLVLNLVLSKYIYESWDLIEEEKNIENCSLMEGLSNIQMVQAIPECHLKGYPRCLSIPFIYWKDLLFAFISLLISQIGKNILVSFLVE